MLRHVGKGNTQSGTAPHWLPAKTPAPNSGTVDRRAVQGNPRSRTWADFMRVGPGRNRRPLLCIQSASVFVPSCVEFVLPRIPISHTCSALLSLKRRSLRRPPADPEPAKLPRKVVQSACEYWSHEGTAQTCSQAANVCNWPSAWVCWGLGRLAQ